MHIDAANAATGCEIQEQVAGSLVIQSQSPGGIVALGLHDARAVRQVQRGSSVAFVDGQCADQAVACTGLHLVRSEEHTSELQSLMRISYAVFCLKKKT